jgi:hypothetical protein
MFLLVTFGSFGWNSCNSTKAIQTSNEKMVQDTAFDEAAAIAAIKKKIEGREQEPAEAVFENIQIMKGFPAGRVLDIMQMAFSRSLGVSCDHCHVPNDWGNEEKLTKQVTRDMWMMMGEINGELLKNIPNLQSEQPVANCTTCHRGQIKPATSLK